MKIIVIILCIIFSAVSPGLSQSGRKDVKAGNKLYQSQQYQEALNRYRNASIDNPDSPEIHYNTGDALYKLGNFEEAFKEFDKVLTSKDAQLHSQVYYNIGNDLYRMNKLPEAILAYTRALQINPDDRDAKFNLEFVRNKLKQQPKQPSQEQQQQQKEQQGQQQQEQQQQQQQKEQEQKQQKGIEQKEQEKQQQQKQQQMSKEEAERILNALQSDEKDILREQRRMPPETPTRVKKDW